MVSPSYVAATTFSSDANPPALPSIVNGSALRGSPGWEDVGGVDGGVTIHRAPPAAATPRRMAVSAPHEKRRAFGPRRARGVVRLSPALGASAGGGSRSAATTSV